MLFLEGTITEIAFQNKENGFTVLEILSEGKYHTCVGSIPMVKSGEYIRLYGNHTTHKLYGEQFRIESIESKTPKNVDSIEMFLGSGLIKGVKSKLAARIVQQFGTQSLDIIENNPLELINVKGISHKLALSIHEQYDSIREMRTAIMELQELGLSVSNSVQAYSAYGAAAAYLIQQNPYRLAEDIRGIGFERADEIAAKLGRENYTELRILSGIKHLLTSKLIQGHTCYPLDRLVRESCSFLRVGESIVSDAISELVIARRLVERNYNNVRAIALAYAHDAEIFCAQKLVQLYTFPARRTVDNKTARKFLANDSFLTEEQLDAAMLVLSNSVSVVTGGPGTGKTTILNQIISCLEYNGITTVLTAPTGRAAKRMEKATGRQACTIHRLLEFGSSRDGLDTNSWDCNFMRNEENPLKADAIVVDESSMIDIFLLKNLLAAIPTGTRVIFTGDSDQLPPVGPGNTLKDMIISKIIPIAKLTEVFRHHGNIALFAHYINNGVFSKDLSTHDLVLVNVNSTDEAMENIKSICTSSLENGIPLDEIQVICPIKKSQLGVNSLNEELRTLLNPPAYDKRELIVGEKLIRTGDKVMQTVNNYTKEWSVSGGPNGTGVFNGDVGVVCGVDTDNGTVDVLFDGERLCEYETKELLQLDLSYAITVHKSQGSEFDTVILSLFQGQSDFLTKNLLYTAITRAKNKLFIVGRESTLQFMTTNRLVSQRFTGLKYELPYCINHVETVQESEVDAKYTELLSSFKLDT